MNSFNQQSSWMIKLFISLTILSSSIINATQLQYGDDLTCSSPVYIIVKEATCDGGNSGICSLGDELHTSGYLTLQEDLPSTNMCISMKACLNGYSWMCKTFHNTVDDICTEMNLQGVNGETCPEAGQYTFDGDVSLPGNTGFSLGSGTYIY